MTSEYNLTSEHIMKIAVFVARKNRFKCFFFLRSVHTIIIFYKRFIVGVNAINYQLIYQ